ncbi:MAG: DUF2330 domain-containing protein [Polyangiaceae bacterium]
MNRLAKMIAVAAPLAAATFLHHGDASACGGCFHPPTSSTVVSGHRMALSVSMTRTVLWDQIQYQGDPTEFSWVLPIKPGARIEEADPAWFETLDASTDTVVQAPELDCSGGAFGCGSSNFGGAVNYAEGDSGGEDPGHVTVVKQEVVGPYEAVTLSSQDPGALAAWLTSHGYDIPDDIQPIISAYVNEGFDFIALRLIPGNGVNLMKPVRVITDGASPVLPLRMVSAGTGAYTSIVLYVIGEGRWETKGYINKVVPENQIVWDGGANTSNYAELRQNLLSPAGGLAWLTTYAKKNTLVDSIDPDFGDYGNGMADTYVYTLQDPSGTNYSDIQTCLQTIDAVDKAQLVVDTCDPSGMTCSDPPAGQTDARKFACGALTDLSTALVGMHPKDVWVTRLEGNLPHYALANDMELQASADQGEVNNFHVAESAVDYECPSAPAPFATKSNKTPSKPSGGGDGTPLVIVGLGAMAALLTMRRARARLASQA